MSGLAMLKQEVKTELVKQTPDLVRDLMAKVLQGREVAEPGKVAADAPAKTAEDKGSERKGSEFEPLKNYKKYSNVDSLIKYIEEPSGGLKVVILNFND